MFSTEDATKRDWKVHVLCVVFVVYLGFSFTNMPKQLPAPVDAARPPDIAVPMQGHLKGVDAPPRDPRPVGDVKFKEILGWR